MFPKNIIVLVSIRQKMRGFIYTVTYKLGFSDVVKLVVYLSAGKQLRSKKIRLAGLTIWRALTIFRADDTVLPETISDGLPLKSIFSQFWEFSWDDYRQVYSPEKWMPGVDDVSASRFLGRE